MPFLQPPPVLTSCTIIIQHQNQEVGIGTIHRAYSVFTNYACTRVCVCVYDIFVTYIALHNHNHHHNQDTELYHHHKAVPYHSFTPIPNYWQLSICSPSCKLLFNKWYIMESRSIDFGLALFTQHNSFESHPSCFFFFCIYQ